ncbi:uncharacterized protein K452DRAFT_144859 [Aplosporella prunicola CBS 121167]|uniref:ABM domain-containing protein n=1 Tax=Aplosporella prunicola CBS 121167 TaxID=1176127 RepID=A0A6A6BKS5_9PEZI|nr:uncharacterized protein K452DRAFT_144859 [Aplosporella prunicola CBS 121167]KAF2144636.1 hypothetical protein K452DRAFT_144859 [Aplosporella prunicola CBS 121167]
MSGVTEITILPFQAGTNAQDKDSDAAKTWRQTLEVVSRQPGFRRMSYGVQLEDPDIIQMLVDWDSIAAHQAFVDSDAYLPFHKIFEKLLSAPPSTHHVRFSAPHAPSTSATVTELVTCYFPSSYKGDFESVWSDFQSLAREHASGLVGISSGWVVEEVEHCSLRDDGSAGRGRRGSLSGSDKPCPKGKAFVWAMGWERVEAHMGYRQTAWFKAGMARLREQPRGIEMHHVRFSM